MPTTAISSEIELRGYFKLGDDYYFSIHQKKVDPKAKRKKSEWVKIGEETEGQFRALRFDSKAEQLTVEWLGITEEIDLHESQWGKKPVSNKKKSTGRSLPIPRPVARKTVMPPQPKTTPALPASLSRTPSINPVKPATSSSSNAPRVPRPVMPSSSGSSGFIARPFVPPRITAPSAPAGPDAGSRSGPPSGPVEGITSSPSQPSTTGSHPWTNFPASNISNISSGNGSATGEIDLSNLPPPPPPPNILPPGPPPDIEPSLEER